MSAIFLRKSVNFRNIRRFLLYSLSRDSNLRITNPILNRIARHECLGSLAHNYKSSESSNLRERSEVPHSKSVDEVLLDLDFNIQRIGRVSRYQVEGILSMLVDLGTPPTKNQSLYLLRCCGLMRKEYPKERIELTETVWKKLQDLGSQYELSHYNALLKVYVDNNHEFSPSDFLTVLESNNIQPNKVTFLYLMQKYCNDGNLDGAGEVLGFMREKGLPINENVFNTLITGHMNANDYSGAKDILKVMRSSNLNPGAQSYVALASGYAKRGDIKAVKSVLQDMQDAEITPSVTNYLSILSSLSSDEHLAFVDEVIALMGEDIHEWKQDALNTVLDLLSKNACESGFRLVVAVTKPGERSNYNTNIFIGQLVKTGQPFERIKHYCDEITARDLHDFVIVNTAKVASEHKRFDLSFLLLEEMQKKGIPLRCQQFWPALAASTSEEETLKILKNMYDLGIPTDFNTYVDYVFPRMNVSSPNEVIKKIQETGQSQAGIIEPLFYFYCYDGKSKQALTLVQNNPIQMIPAFNMEKFMTSHSSDIMRNPQSSFHQVLLHILKNVGNNGKDADVMRGTCLADLISFSPQVFQAMLRSSEDFSLNGRSLDVCYNILQKKDPKMLVHLRRLEKPVAQRVQSKPLSIEEEDRELKQLKKNGHSVDSYLQQILLVHIKERNIERVKQLTAELENLNITCSALLYSQLFTFFKYQDNIEMAAKYLKKLRETYPDFVIDTAQVLDYALTLIKYSKLEEAQRVIKTECQELRINGSKDFLIRAIKRIFHAAIETNNVDLVRSIQSSLIHHAKDLQVTRLFFEPLIKMHLFRNDLDGAIQEFQSINVHHRSAPCLNTLLKKCVLADDHVKLEAVINAASATEGRIKVLHEVFMAFFDTGRKAQARKILENLESQIDPDFMENMCSRLCNNNEASELLDLVSVVSDLDHVDQSKALSYLFQLYDRRNDHKKALDLYNGMQTAKLSFLNAETKKLLVGLLKRNRVAVPSSLAVEKKEENVVDETSATRISDTSVEELHEVLAKGDAFEAIRQLETMKKGLIRTIPLFDMTQLISILTEKNLLNSLSENVQVMSYLIEHANDILNPLLTRFAEVGDVESINQLSSFLPDFVLINCSFNSYLCKAHINSGKHEELLTLMESRWNLKNKIFNAVAFLEILGHPDLRERAINLAKLYLEKKFQSPIAIVWAHYVINENFDAAEELAKEFSPVYDKADAIIFRAIKQKESLTIARLYVDKIKELNPRPRSKDRAYGALLDLLVLKEMYSEAADLVTEAKAKNIKLEAHNQSTLMTLKSALERENKPVPFTIPSEESFISARSFT